MISWLQHLLGNAPKETQQRNKKQDIFTHKTLSSDTEVNLYKTLRNMHTSLQNREKKQNHMSLTAATKENSADPKFHIEVFVIADGKKQFQAVVDRLQNEFDKEPLGLSEKSRTWIRPYQIRHVPANMVHVAPEWMQDTRYQYPEEIGIHRSHIRALKQANDLCQHQYDLEKNNTVHKHIYCLVLESDVHFCRNFEKKVIEYLENLHYKQAHMSQTPIFKLGNNTTYGGSWGAYALLYPLRTVEPLMAHLVKQQNQKTPLYQDAIDRVMNLPDMKHQFPVIDIPKQEDLIVPDISTSSVRGPRNQLSRGWRLENFPSMHSFSVQKFVFIVPFYNVSKYIEKTLPSILQQSYPHFRVVLVDDASTDDTVNKIESMLSMPAYKHLDVKLIRNERRRGQAYNRYLVYSSREFVSVDDVCVLLDGDDWLADRDVLRRAALCMVQQHADAAFTNYLYYPESKPPLRGVWNLPKLDARRNESYRHHRHNIASHPRFFHAALLRQIREEDLYCPEYSTTETIPFCTDTNENMICLDFAHNPCYFGDVPFTKNDPMVVYNKENSLNYPKTSYYTTKHSQDRKIIENWVHSAQSNRVDWQQTKNLLIASEQCIRPVYSGVVFLVPNPPTEFSSWQQKQVENWVSMWGLFGYSSTTETSDWMYYPIASPSTAWNSTKTRLNNTILEEISEKQPRWQHVVFVNLLETSDEKDASSFCVQSLRGLPWIPYFQEAMVDVQLDNSENHHVLVLATKSLRSNIATTNTVPERQKPLQQYAVGNGIKKIASPFCLEQAMVFGVHNIPGLSNSINQERQPLYMIEPTLFTSLDSQKKKAGRQQSPNKKKTG